MWPIKKATVGGSIPPVASEGFHSHTYQEQGSWDLQLQVLPIEMKRMRSSCVDLWVITKNFTWQIYFVYMCGNDSLASVSVVMITPGTTPTQLESGPLHPSNELLAPTYFGWCVGLDVVTAHVYRGESASVIPFSATSETSVGVQWLKHIARRFNSQTKVFRTAGSQQHE